MTESSSVLIIGGGVIGVCSAYYLAEQGVDVVLVEKGEICSGASYGNAGLLTPSHVVPLSAPGVLTQGLKWMLDSDSPFYIKPRIDAQLLSWLWRFYRSCNQTHLRAAMPVIRALSQRSMELFIEIVATENIDCGFHQNGWIQLFATQAGLNEGREEANLASEVGVEARFLSTEEIRAINPHLSKFLVGAINYPGDGHLEPGAFVTGLADVLRSKGVRIHTSHQVRNIEFGSGDTISIDTNRGAFEASQLVLATGWWSPDLARSTGVSIPVQPAKGYGIILARPADFAETPFLLGEASVGVTPMGDKLRLAGTLELAGPDMAITQRRVDAIRRQALQYFPELDTSDPIEIWRGMRPCSPDGLPIIGRTQSHPNLIIATGHGMLGVTQGPCTGKLVADIIAGGPTEIEIEPFTPNRFA